MPYWHSEVSVLSIYSPLGASARGGGQDTRRQTVPDAALYHADDDSSSIVVGGVSGIAGVGGDETKSDHRTRQKALVGAQNQALYLHDKEAANHEKHQHGAIEMCENSTTFGASWCAAAA